MKNIVTHIKIVQLKKLENIFQIYKTLKKINNKRHTLSPHIYILHEFYYELTE